MTEVYRIIRDQKKLKDFIESLPPLLESERWYLCLQARKKYMPELQSSDKTQLRRVLSKTKDLISKIRQMECVVGAYTTKKGDPIPDEAMALYITSNPRCLRKATINGIKALADGVGKDEHYNPHADLLSVVHKSKGTIHYVHLDVDCGAGECEDVLNAVRDIVGQEAVQGLATRGGIHLLVRPGLASTQNKHWHNQINKLAIVDQRGDLMMPVPGCNQGGFVPWMMN